MDHTASATIDRFVAEAERTDARVHRCADWSAVARLALELAGDGKVALAPSLGGPGELVAALGDRALLPPEIDNAGTSAVGAVADVPVGIVRARAAVAESGSVLLIEESSAERAVSMLSRALIEIVTPDQLVPDLFALRSTLAPGGHRGPPRYAVLVTGPSRTADIERSLTIGVQGPAAVHVVLLG